MKDVFVTLNVNTRELFTSGYTTYSETETLMEKTSSLSSLKILMWVLSVGLRN